MSSQIDIYLNNTRIPIEGQTGIRLNRLVTEIREPEKRGASWSKTIRIPGSDQVNQLLGHIYDIKHRIQGDTDATVNFTPDFNPNLKASAVILADGIPILQGYARLLNIPTLKGRIIYEMAMAGDAKDLFAILGGRKLRELDMTDLNHTLSRTNVENSWATSYVQDGSPVAFAYGSGYVYPLLDQGGNSIQRKFILEDMYPAIAAREIALRIFTEAGYSWKAGGFFDSTFFKRLYVPYPGTSISITEDEMLDREWKAQRTTTDQTMTYGDTLVLNDDSSTGMYDPAAAYDTTTGEWTVPVTGRYTIALNLDAEVDFTVSGRSNALFEVRVNGAARAYVFSQEFTHGTSALDITIQGETQSIHLDAGDTVEIQLYGFMDPSFVLRAVGTVTSFKVYQDSYGLVETDPRTHTAGETVDFTGFFDLERTQREFLMDLVRAFNLYISTDDDAGRTLMVETRADFYNDTVLDWSAKIDTNQDIEIIPLGELQDRTYSFRTTDSGDISNSNYKARYGQAFGDYTFRVNNDFVTSDREIKLGFTPTPSINYGATWDAVLPHIEYQDGKRTTGYRLLYYAGLKNCGSWTILDSPTSGASSGTFTQYPYMGHTDDPSQPTLDLNWGMPREVALALKAGSAYTNNNLFNRYWREYLQEITDPNSKILRARFWLTPADWQSTTLRELIYCEGEYFRINSLKDYDPENNGLTTVELIKTVTVPAFTATQQRGGRGNDTSDGYGDRFPDTVKGGFKAAGNQGPGTKTGGSGGEVLGGFGNEAHAGQVAFFAGNQNWCFAEAVQFFNCTGCVAKPTAKGSVLINCTNLIIDTPGFYYNNLPIESLNTTGTGSDVLIDGGGFVPEAAAALLIDCGNFV